VIAGSDLPGTFSGQWMVEISFSSCGYSALFTEEALCKELKISGERSLRASGSFSNSERISSLPLRARVELFDQF
jgi:hypothetical protein